MSDADKKQLNKEQDFKVTEELEAKVQAHLDAVVDSDEDPVEDIPRLEKKKDEEEEVKDDEVKDDKEKEDDDEVKDDEVKDTDEDDVKDEVKDEVKDDKKVEYVLPENYFQAMQHVGWDVERIKETFEKDPEQALKDFKFYHDSQNYITQQTSNLGRTQKAQTERATQEATTKEAKPEYKGVDVKAFEEQFGEENPAAVAMMKAMNESNKLLHDEVQTLKQQQTQQAGPTDAEKVIWNTIITHFDSDALKGFNEFYGKVESGKNWDQSLTGAQLQARMKVVKEADAYHAGMQLQGKDVEYSEALTRAHLVVSAPIQETILREQLHGKIKKRSKGITVKTSGRKTVKESSKDDKSEEGLIKRTKQRMKVAFGKTPEN